MINRTYRKFHLRKANRRRTLTVRPVTNNLVLSQSLMIDPDGFLMIEPLKLPERVVNDALTRKTAAALRTARTGRRFRGWHWCICGARSGNAELFVTIDGKEKLTNSLAVHYVACHRDEIPVSQLRQIEEMSDEAEPTVEELLDTADQPRNLR